MATDFAWKPNIRPHGESFALNQAITATAVAGNVTANNPMRLDQAQGATAIRVVVPREAGKTLVVPAGATVTLTVSGAKTEAGTPIVLGTAVYTNDTAASITFTPDSTITEYVISEVAFAYPYVRVSIHGSVASTGSVDVFPHQISHPRR